MNTLLLLNTYFITVVTEVFDAEAPRTFKASCNFAQGDEGHVYEPKNMHDNTFTTSELLSIQLNDIVMLFKCSTECHRQLVWLFNTAIEKVINDLERGKFR